MVLYRGCGTGFLYLCFTIRGNQRLSCCVREEDSYETAKTACMAGYFVHSGFVFRNRLRKFTEKRTGDNSCCTDGSKSDRENGTV